MQKFLAVLLMILPSAALADSSYALAKKLGNVISAEQACKFSFDQEYIERWIDDYVDSHDMDFVDHLALNISSSKRELGKMSRSEKTAYCAQVERVAKYYKFL